MLEHINGAITKPIGYKASGVVGGIKSADSDKKDVAIVLSDVPATVGAVFTTNVVKAAPVLYAKTVVDNGIARGFVINSGNANACTGDEGYQNTVSMAKIAGKALGIDDKLMLVSSTGVIGHQLPMDRVESGIKKACDALGDFGHDAAVAIMTTDLVPKETAISFELGGKTITIGGMAKGSGMINPNMATMLGFITTDAKLSHKAAQKAIKEAADESFNLIFVDGDTSTNDSLFLMANGMAGNNEIEVGTPEYRMFIANLKEVCIYLGKRIARDGEGATRLVEAEVLHAPSVADARKIAKSVISSSLVKTAIYGEDANWGRIICAAGYAGVDFDPNKVDILIKSAAGEELMCRDGKGLEFNEDNAATVLKEENIFIVIDLKQGDCFAKSWGCDLTYDYVKINADYRT